MKKVHEMKKRIDQHTVNEYCQVNAQVDKLEKRRLALKDKIVPKFQSGYVCPTGGPYILELSESERKSIQWKEELNDLFKRIARQYPELKKQLLAKWKNGQKRVEEDAEKIEIVRLIVKANSKYNANAA